MDDLPKLTPRLAALYNQANAEGESEDAIELASELDELGEILKIVTEDEDVIRAVRNSALGSGQIRRQLIVPRIGPRPTCCEACGRPF